MDCVELVNMEFYARHGCFEEERIIGNRFVVNLRVQGDFSAAARTDDLREAVNYQELYDIVKREMDIPSRLLEHVAGRILAGIRERFPRAAHAQVGIDKLNPPLGGQVGASRVTMGY